MALLRAPRVSFEIRLPSMGTDPRNAASEKNWKLQAELEAADSRSALEDMVGFLRRPPAAKEAKAIEADVPKDVVITHDGERLFAYAADEATIVATRAAIESARTRDGLTTRAISISHWTSSSTIGGRSIRRRRQRSSSKQQPLPSMMPRSKKRARSSRAPGGSSALNSSSHSTSGRASSECSAKSSSIRTC
jgi:hypothetical protein